MRRDRRVGPIFTLAIGLAAAIPFPAAGGDTPSAESWDAVYIRGQRVGYFHTSVTPVKDRDKTYQRVRVDMTLSFKRNNDPVTIETMYGTIETLDGSVLRLDSRTVASRQEMRIYGDVINGEMNLHLEGSGQSQESKLAWGPDVRGPYGAELSMSRKPMEPGEVREVKVFIPDVNRIGVARLTAKGRESVPLGGNTRRDLLRVEQVTLLDGKPVPGMAQTQFVDHTGQILRVSMEVFGGFETYRTTREAALRSIGGTRFDLNQSSFIMVKQPITSPTERRQITYDIAMRGDEPAKVFPNDRRQTVTADSADPTRGRLVVRTVGNDEGEPGPEAVEPQYLRPNALITSGDRRVVALANAATAGAADPMQKATAISHWVFENIKKKNFGTAFAAANEVARDLSGDCSEHTVLAAAMCRVVGIPSRVVVGLVYVESERAFGFHMWVEVYVNRHWVALDPTWDESQVDATHLKLTESSLDGVAPNEPFLAVVRVFDKTSVEPVEVR